MSILWFIETELHPLDVNTVPVNRFSVKIGKRHTTVLKAPSSTLKGRIKHQVL
jgi:hypothetical protein